jgi:hypothetical protein
MLMLPRRVKVSRSEPKARALKPILPLLLATSVLVELFASTTQYPNQVNVIYSGIVLGVALMTTPAHSSFRRSFQKWILLPASYVVVFMIVSYYGVSFDASISNHVLYMPLWLVNFTSCFMVGYFFHERIYLRYLCQVCGVFGVASLVFAMFEWIDPDQTRIISGLDLPAATSVAVTSGDLFWTGILLFISFFSLKKTVVACTIGAVLAAFTLKKITKSPNFILSEKVRSQIDVQFSRLIKTISFAVLCIALLSIFSPYMFATVQRLLLEKEDIIRSSADAEAYRILRENFPFGIGYGTFGHLTRDTLQYATYTASGDRIDDGMSLHNTFMHIAVEGGLPIIVIVLFFYWNLGKVVRRLLLFDLSKPLAIILITWAIISVLFGLFNQLHATRYFFGIFAFAFGCYERYRIEHDLDNLIRARKAQRNGIRPALLQKTFNQPPVSQINDVSEIASIRNPSSRV